MDEGTSEAPGLVQPKRTSNRADISNLKRRETCVVAEKRHPRHRVLPSAAPSLHEHHVVPVAPAPGRDRRRGLRMAAPSHDVSVRHLGTVLHVEVTRAAQPQRRNRCGATREKRDAGRAKARERRPSVLPGKKAPSGSWTALTDLDDDDDDDDDEYDDDDEEEDEDEEDDDDEEDEEDDDGHGAVQEVDTLEEFEAILGEAGGSLVVVDFSATWCGPCRQIAPAYAEMSEEVGWPLRRIPWMFCAIRGGIAHSRGS
eukprot:scaffold379_cov235-Pinguiococcus_pyrenoidosus.AAC.20